MTSRTTGPASGLPSQWARLHGLSPLLRSVRPAVAMVSVLALRQLSPGQTQSPFVDLIAVGIAVTAGTVSWLVTRWRIHNSELQIETGLVRRQSVRVPLSRVQAVDVVRPLLARVLGLAEVRLVVAGHGSSNARLAYLTEARAADVRARLLALAHGLEADTPEPAARPLLSVPGGRIVAAHLLTPGPLVLVGLLVVSLTLVVTSPTVAVALSSTAIALGIALTLAVVRSIGEEWEFTVAEAPDGLRLTAGLLQTRAETIPYGRTQAVRWVEPMLWRPWHKVRLEIDVARRRDRDRAENEAGATTRALLPVGDRQEALDLLGRVLPGASIDTSESSRAPRRVRLRAPLMRHHLAAWYDDRYIVCVTGRVRRSVVIVPLDKVQSVRWTQGPLSRLLHLATVHADTAGRRFPGQALFRDEGEAAQWVQSLPDLARDARAQPIARPSHRDPLQPTVM